MSKVRGKKKYLPISILLMSLVILILAPIIAMPVHAADKPIVTVEMPNGYIPEKSVGAKFWIYFLIDADCFTYNDPTAMYGWGIYVQTNPAVLKPFSTKLAVPGLLLYDFADQNFYTYPDKVSAINQETGWVDMAEQWFAPMPDGGAATDDFYLPAPYRLCAVAYEVMSSGYSKIDIIDPEWMDINSDWHPMDHVDGHYGQPPVPEFPLGAALEVGLIVAVVYLWWTRRRKLREVP